MPRCPICKARVEIVFEVTASLAALTAMGIEPSEDPELSACEKCLQFIEWFDEASPKK